MVERREVLKPTPLDFVVIGSGQAVDKYWLRSESDGSVNITDIVSLEPEQSFRHRNPNFPGAYHVSKSVDDTFLILAKLTERGSNLNIANVASSDIRLELTQRILTDPRFNKTRLFIEKPYAAKKEEVDAFALLVGEHSSRLHFSGKYANGRANILYPHLPQGKIPTRITGRLIEGRDYFNYVRERVVLEGTHQYLIDGPELDLGFHLLDIIAVASQRFGGIKDLRVRDVYELSDRRSDFEKGYGFGVSAVIETPSGATIEVDLQAGKGDTENERYMEFEYGDITYGQEYTVGDSIDPVYESRHGLKQVIAQHDPGYNYYATDLSPAVFCKQQPSQQRLGLYITGVALDIKQRRLGL